MCVSDLDERLSRQEMIGWIAYYSILADEERMREHQRNVK